MAANSNKKNSNQQSSSQAAVGLSSSSSFGPNPTADTLIQALPYIQRFAAR